MTGFTDSGSGSRGSAAACGNVLGVCEMDGVFEAEAQKPVDCDVDGLDERDL